MVIVKVQGGLGNQLFQCAFARGFAGRGIDAYLDDDLYQQSNRAARRQHNGFDLKVHMDPGVGIASAKELEQLRIARHHATAEKPSMLHSLRRWTQLGYRRRFVVEDQTRYSPDYVTRDDVYFDGYWQNERYFLDVRDDLRRAMHAIPMEGESAALRESIRNVEAVSVHVRRGDYLKLKLFAGLCDLSYYGRAIGHVREHVANPRFFVFSDDLEWCRAKLPLPAVETTFVEGNRALKSMYDLLLMGACKHNIVANSSFSWWGAWMNPNPGKIVISPMRWYNHEKREAGLELPKGWLRL